MENEREQKKNLILDAAFDIFIEKGYTNAKMSEIAQKAGLAKASLYEYFNTKESLFNELLDSHVISAYFAIAGRVDGGQSCEDQIKSFMRMEMEYMFALMKDKNVLPANILHMEMISNSAIASAAEKIIEFKFDFLRNLIVRGIETGEFENRNPVILTASIIGAFNFFVALSCRMKTNLFPKLNAFKLSDKNSGANCPLSAGCLPVADCLPVANDHPDANGLPNAGCLSGANCPPDANCLSDAAFFAMIFDGMKVR